MSEPEIDAESKSENNNNLLNKSTEKAIDQYRNARENSNKDKELTEKEIAEIDKECEIIRIVK